MYDYENYREGLRAWYGFGAWGDGFTPPLSYEAKRFQLRYIFDLD